ncbi:MAG: hypothetical protein B7Y74_11175, partial [Novosphingobium sp. 35-62-5]
MKHLRCYPSTMQEPVVDPLSFGWYDSLWLRRYFEAKAVIARVAPGRLAEFNAAMQVFKTDPSYEVRYVSAFLDNAKRAAIKEAITAIPREQLEFHELEKFGRLVVHDWPPFTALQAEITGLVSELAGERLEPCYNFLSLYSRRGVCETHLDTPSAKWTFDICVDQSDPWPISFTSIIDWPETSDDLVDEWRAVKEGRADHAVHTLTLEPGDALLFSGASQWHWRDPIPPARGRTFCDLLFFHYIPEGTSELVQPRNWAKLFNV